LNKTLKNCIIILFKDVIIIPTHEENIHNWEKAMDDIEKLCPDTGLLPSPPDPRDYSIDDIPVSIGKLPERHVLSAPPFILNQGSTPYCAGASGAGAANAYYSNPTMPLSLMPKNGFSMTFLYWLAKRYDGIPDRSGTYIRTLLKMMKKYGCAPLQYAPYSTSRIAITGEALKAAEQYQIESYARLFNERDIKEALNKNMYVIIGTLVTRDNWNRRQGFLAYPQGSLYGGHATVLRGYDDNLINIHAEELIGHYLGFNSWGERWGDRGTFYLPYDYQQMVYENRKVFLEAWAVKFYDYDSHGNKKKEVLPKPIIPTPQRPVQPNIDIDRIQNDIRERINNIRKRIANLINRR